ncbi:ricin-type beta-trefoil lectin domain protein [Streptomyces xanthophaeus]|uniref:ricin-type beta-trefoil lectin domain protein n=1 Tax=Streptomyces xanthophaeus TaxID=67385 RepID=UPI0004CD17F9|nr:RICIN domain-containing protein [Streptomyces xanthophaeus]
MSRPGRPPGPLKGRTAEANDLAQFLRDLTTEHTVSRLAELYGGNRTGWSEYRSGQLIIPLSRLKQVVEDRYARDARTRDQTLQEARRLCSAAMAASAAVNTAGTAAVSAPTAQPAPAAGHADPAAASAPETPSTPDTAETPADRESAATTPDRNPVPDDPLGGEPGALSADNPLTAPDAGEPVVSHSLAGPGESSGRRAGRWRTPAQWAALAALVAVLVIANRPDHANDPSADASSPNDPGQDQQTSAPADPGSAPSATPTPETSGPAATPEPSADPPSSAPAQPAPAEKKPAPAASPPPLAAPPASPLHRTLRNVTTGKCLDIATGGIPNQGSKITQFDCGAGSGHQQAFDLVDGTDGLLIRSSAQPALCFDLPDYGAPTKAYVGLYPCQNTTADNQLWYRKWNADQGAFLLVNVKSDQAGRPMCLDVDDYSTKTNGQRVGIAPCNYTNNDDHWWTLP